LSACYLLTNNYPTCFNALSHLHSTTWYFTLASYDALHSSFMGMPTWYKGHFNFVDTKPPPTFHFGFAYIRLHICYNSTYNPLDIIRFPILLCGAFSMKKKPSQVFKNSPTCTSLIFQWNPIYITLGPCTLHFPHPF
jgi:hypothetical protein